MRLREGPVGLILVVLREEEIRETQLVSVEVILVVSNLLILEVVRVVSNLPFQVGSSEVRVPAIKTQVTQEELVEPTQERENPANQAAAAVNQAKRKIQVTQEAVVVLVKPLKPLLSSNAKHPYLKKATNHENPICSGKIQSLVYMKKIYKKPIW